MPLLNRHVFIPGGFQYFQPQTSWPKSQSELSGLTFDQVCERIAQHRAANPRFGLTTDLDAIASEVDRYNCIRIKYDPNYCTGGGADPKALRPTLRLPTPGTTLAGSVRSAVVKAVKITQGIGVLIDMLGSGAKAVAPELATQRASVCVQCPKNAKGDWLAYFTGPAAAKIKDYMELKNQMRLTTPYDAQLNVCQACLCHLQTKVHVPITHIIKKLQPEMKAELWEKCWIRKEESENQSKPIG